MTREIYTYVLIKSLFDKEKDYMDCFIPIALSCMPKNGSISPRDIAQEIKTKYNIFVPYDVVTSILLKSMNKKFVSESSPWIKTEEPEYILTSKGINYSNNLEVQYDVERRITLLITDLKLHFENKGSILSEEEVQSILESFIKENILSLTHFLNPNEPNYKIIPKKEKKYDAILVDYISTIEEKKPVEEKKSQAYKILHDMILGSILSLVFYAEEISDITKEEDNKFETYEVFLDSNYVFSVLNLQDEKICEPKVELFTLLKKYKFKIKILSTTVDEICRVVSNYPSVLKYSKEDKINPITHAIYSYMKENRWTKANVIYFLENIEKTLNDLNIEIVYLDLIDLKSYTPKHVPLNKRLQDYKPFSSICVISHDLIAIDQIIERRPHTCRRFEECRSFFLTSDPRLSEYDYIELGHKNNGTISEVILDNLLTNILWLRDPSTNLPIKSTIAFHSKDLLRDTQLWGKFEETLNKLACDDTSVGDQIANLIYRNYVEDTIRTYVDSETDEIDLKVLFSDVKKGAEAIPVSLNKKLEGYNTKHEAELISKLISKTKYEISSEASENIKREQEENFKTKLNEYLKRSSLEEAKYYSNFVYICLLLFFSFLIYCLYILIPTEINLILILPIIFSGCILLIHTRIKENIQKKLFEHIYTKKKTEIHLIDTTSKPR